MDSLCSLHFYMKCEIFEYSSRVDLENKINKFIRGKINVNISLSVSTVGYSSYYTAIVYWEE